MHFIVTGGAGFIGSHLTDHLLSNGHQVTVVDNLTTGLLGNLPSHHNLKLLNKDIKACQPQDFAQPVDGVAHLAATPSVANSWQQPIETHHNNLSAILSIIELCQLLNIPRLVFASSAAVYGNQLSDQISESLTPQPISPYGLQKLVSEQYAHLFASQNGFSFIGLRLFNVFGPRQVTTSPYSGVISIFVNSILKGLPITVYGDGRQTRDFIYVEDVVQAFTLALTHSSEIDSYRIYNIGTGTSVSLMQLIDILRASFPNSPSTLNFAPARAGDIAHSQSNISKSQTELGFSPQWSIESGLQALAKSILAERTTLERV